MKITKAASVELSGAPSAEQLEKINRLTKKAVTAEEVYVFSVRLCDDQVDRDDERFSESCIRELAALFIGMWGDRIFEKCGIGRDEGGDGGKTLEIRGKRRLSARDGGANYQQS